MRILQTYEHKGLTLLVAAEEAEPSARAKLSLARAPGARKFGIERIEAVLEGEEVVLSGRISGKNVAYVYAELLLKDPDAERYYGPVAREHVEAGRTKETRGVARPDWEEYLDLRVRLAPSLRVLGDGVDSAFCFPVPEGYGRPDHRLDGLYVSAGVPAEGTAVDDSDAAAAAASPAAAAASHVATARAAAAAPDITAVRAADTRRDAAAPRGGTSFRARLIIDETGQIRQIVARKEQGRRALPHVLTPKPGDRFTPFVQTLTPPTDDGEWGVETLLSTTLTFRDAPLRVVTYAPIPGDYLAGLLVEDFDGRLTRRYVPLTIGGEAD